MKIEKFQWELWEWNADGVTVICCLEYAGNENKFCFVLCNSKKSQPMQTYQRSLHNFMEDKPTILAYAH
jgi:hypothetical protein